MELPRNVWFDSPFSRTITMAAVIVGLKMIEALISVFSLLAFRVVVIWGVGCSLEATRVIMGVSQPELCIKIGSK